jgi:hypothetical protein
VPSAGVRCHLLPGARWHCLAAATGGVPPPTTVYAIFARWTGTGVWQRIHDALCDRLRVRVGRNSLSAGGGDQPPDRARGGHHAWFQWRLGWWETMVANAPRGGCDQAGVGRAGHRRQHPGPRRRPRLLAGSCASSAPSGRSGPMGVIPGGWSGGARPRPAGTDHQTAARSRVPGSALGVGDRKDDRLANTGAWCATTKPAPITTRPWFT